MLDRGEWSEFGREQLLDFLDCVDEIVAGSLARIRLGVYDEDLDGDLKTVLEEIERMLR